MARRARLHVQLAVDYHEDDRIIEAGVPAGKIVLDPTLG